MKQTFISLLGFLVVVLPAFFVRVELIETLNDNYNSLIWDISLYAENELQNFRSDITPINAVETIIKKAELQAKLTWESEMSPVFPPHQDPGIYNDDTLTELIDIFENRFQMKPMLLVVAQYNLRDISLWYQPDLVEVGKEDMFFLRTGMGTIIANQLDRRKLHNNPDKERLQKKFGKFLNGWRRQLCAEQHVFTKYISDFAFLFRNYGQCYLIHSKIKDSPHIFGYKEKIHSNKSFLGGYAVFFASKDVPASTIATIAKKNASKGFKRNLVDTTFKPEPNTIALQTSAPIEYILHQNVSYQNQNKRLQVTYDYSNLQKQHARNIKTVSFIFNLIVLATYFASIYFWLFSFPQHWNIRKKILSTVALISLVPSSLMVFTALMLSDSMENIRKFEMVKDNQNHVYEFVNFLDDTRLCITTNLQKYKKELIHTLNDKGINNLHSNFLAPKSPRIIFNLIYYDEDIEKRLTPVSSRSEMPSLFSMIARRYLYNLGLLQTQTGFDPMAAAAEITSTSSMHQYFDYFSMNKESAEAKSTIEYSDGSTMVFYLIPDLDDKSRIKAIVVVEFMDASNDFYCFNSFPEGMFYNYTDSLSHRIAIASVREDEGFFNFYPDRLRSDSNLLKLLRHNALRRTNSVTRLTDPFGNNIVLSQLFLKDSFNAVSSITNSQHQRIENTLFIVSFALFIIVSLISVFLFSDILNSFLVKPLNAFIQGAKKIRDGQYSLTINSTIKDEFSLLANSFNHLAEELTRREKLKRFVSEKLFSKLSTNNRLTQNRIQHACVTVLSADIRNFTTISEKHNAEDIVNLLNDYFTLMEQAINEYDGFIEKYVGDAITAVFFQKENNDQVKDAIKAAEKMNVLLKKLNQERTQKNLFTINNGIGIATGQSILAITGQSTRMNFGIIGQTVQLAQKLESKTKDIKGNILLCHNTAKMTDIPVKEIEIAANLTAFFISDKDEK